MLRKNKLITLLTLFIGTAALFSGCREKEMNDMLGDSGTVSLGVNFDTKTNPVIATRSNGQDYAIKITDSEGQVVKRYNHKEEVPEEIRLYEGNYTATVSSGENPDAAFDSPYFQGTQAFSVKANQTGSDKVVCTLANAQVSVLYSERVRNYFSDLNTTIWKGKNTLQFTEQTIENGYFKTGTDSVTLKWTLRATNSLGHPLSREEKLIVKPRYHYTLKFDVGEPDESGGVLTFNIIVEEDATVIEDSIGPILLKIPEINGVDFPIDQQLALLFHEDKDIAVDIEGLPSITSAKVSHNCQYLSDNGIPAEFDLITTNQSEKLNGLGISWTEITDKTTFSLTNLLKTNLPAPSPGESTYNLSFKFNVTAANGKRWEETLNLLILKSDVMTSETTNVGEIWAHHATIHGKWVGAGPPANLSFQYQKEGDGDTWLETPEVTINPDNTCSYELSDLESGTKYNYRAKAGSIPANTLSLTTEEASQLPNSDFEDWGTDSDKAIIPYLSGTTPFWETGNHGSITLSKNVTNPTSDRYSGKTAAELKSQFVGIIGIGKFAAGNLFSGSFALDGTDGILTFNREYTSRPTRFQGYYKYKPTAISDGDKIPGGKPDTCSIYIALCDGDPVVVKTKTGDVFNKNDPRVIAYAELGAAQSSGDNLAIEYQYFDLELKYRDLSRRPKYIVVVCAASKYGDFFCGGRGSTLWVDNFNLVFDK